MKYKEELEKIGFKQYPIQEDEFSTYDRGWYYDFSDYESLEFTPIEHTRPDGNSMLKIENLQLYNHFYDETYFSINYELYFKDINEFLNLLKLLGYEMPNK